MLSLLDYKYEILIGAEILFFIFLLLVLLFRYWFRLKQATIVAVIILILSELFVLAVGVYDYLQFGAFSQYQLIIVIFIVYAIVYGRSDFIKFDRWMQRKVAKWKGETIPPQWEEPVKKLVGKEHAKKERQEFYKRLLLYIPALVILTVIDFFVDATVAETIEGIRSVLIIVIVVDFIWSFSYVIWPK